MAVSLQLPALPIANTVLSERSNSSTVISLTESFLDLVDKVFLLPFTLNSIEPMYSISVICVIATLSAVQEGYYIGTGREVA